MQYPRENLRSVYRTLLIFAVLVCVGFASPGGNYPQGYFIAPVERQIFLSGTFGELRSNHFHAGLDIKSRDGSIGEEVHASAPGFISRITVQSGGYGNVLYLDHPNGYTTVYAHLDRFIPEVAAYVKTMQYSLKSFEVTLYPRPDQFIFKQQETIGYLGNSGSSSGPHVHFEIRKTSNQVPCNPLLFGIPVTDNRAPGIRSLKVYYLDSELQKIGERTCTPVYTGPGQYRINDTLTEPAMRLGFGLKVYDQMSGVSNQNGIYALTMSVDDTEQYGFELDAIPFSQTRYLNAHIDYLARQNSQGFFHRCYKLPGNALNIYDEYDGRGIIEPAVDKAHKIYLKARDFAGNISTLEFYVKRDTIAPDQATREVYQRIDYLRSHQINKTDAFLSFEPHTFYQNTDVSYYVDAVATTGLYAPVHHIEPENTPVHRYYDMTLRTSGIPENLKSKAFIAQITDRGKLVNLGGVVTGDHIFARVRSFGTFSVAIDTIAPEIIPITFRANMHGMSRMRFRISDSQAVDGQADGLRYSATVDGKWILMEYEGKRAMLTHWFDEHIGPGTHELVLTVRDDRGNETRLVRTFIL